MKPFKNHFSGRLEAAANFGRQFTGQERGCLMKWIIALFGLLLFFTFANAEIYKWVDEKGTVHFTEDPSTIPEKYREKAKGRFTEEDPTPIREQTRSKQKSGGIEEQKITVPPKYRYTKDEFERMVIGKTKEEIINTFGNPSSIRAASSRRNEYWYYTGGVIRDPVTKTVFLVYDPITEKVFYNIQIVFEYRITYPGISHWKDKKEDYFAVQINY